MNTFLFTVRKDSEITFRLEEVFKKPDCLSAKLPKVKLHCFALVQLYRAKTQILFSEQTSQHVQI